MFGINPATLQESPPTWWGARAIYSPREGYTIDIPWDRRQTTPYEPESIACKALWFWLDNYGIPALHAEVKKLGLQGSEDRLITIESHGFKLVATPRSSYGYLYIGAWPTSPDVVMPPEPPPKKEAPPPKKTAARRRSSTVMNDEEYVGGRRRRW